MKKTINILFFAGWLIYIFLFIAKKQEVILPGYIRYYAADLLAIPLILGLTNFLLKKYTSNPNFELSVAKVLFACVYFSLLFEWILPMYSTNYTQDYLDVICYFIGGGIYYHLSSFRNAKQLEDATTLR